MIFLKIKFSNQTFQYHIILLCIMPTRDTNHLLLDSYNCKSVTIWWKTCNCSNIDFISILEIDDIMASFLTIYQSFIYFSQVHILPFLDYLFVFHTLFKNMI